MNKAVKVKFCGMTRAEDIRFAVKLGVDAVGLVFYPGSKRAVNLAQAQQLAREIPAFVSLVAVMVDPEPKLVKAILQSLPVQYLQFHGNEPASFCNSFHFPYIKAIAGKDGNYIRDSAREYPDAKALLVDTPSSTVSGGTGKSFDWSQLPADLPLPLILAGGLGVDNVAEAIVQCQPFAVDVSSGIETSAGIKCPDKMRYFINAICSRND